ncbi:hypothetical protein Cylst_2282 [Cylindrospermum stagnale PCC 7417]|uniref:Uncharacterized protein n=1 Tax=Cylindrospermum stagnale PCC 7417 TaxID=56107 RepID=K9WYC6_9NOST|nr:hypothetical protein [Cylindrospermum stagnale]AFZ24512.1 hypothetical protein Cylst_2282 [Cylindrospermum stagnale PCC 7417]
MANIKLNDIKPAGAELFTDAESFLNELNETDINKIIGGGSTYARTCTGARTCATKQLPEFYLAG